MNDTEKPTLRLDDQHRYWLGDRRVYGFTEIAREMGVIKDNPFYTAEGREEGVALHKWLRFLSSGKETKEPPHPSIAGRVEGIRKFLRDSKFVLVDGEKALHDHLLDFACTPDAWGTLGNASVVIDAKRGAFQKWHTLQTAAQQTALLRNGFLVNKRFSLYLRDGDYRLEPHTDAQDIARWKAIVAAFHARTFYI